MLCRKVALQHFLTLKDNELLLQAGGVGARVVLLEEVLCEEKSRGGAHRDYIKAYMNLITN
jgi:hypothetical protein